ncbi:MAG TPA: twin-arginine translocase TatA/TatE family subunit [Candidatus Limnocylindrales bacterium]
MGALSPTHLIIILVVAIVILGPGKLPETGEALGKAVRELRRAMADEPTATSPTATVGPEVGSSSADAATSPATTDRGATHRI